MHVGTHVSVSCPLQLAHCCVLLHTEVLGQTPSALINVVINQSNTDICNPSGGRGGGVIGYERELNVEMNNSFDPSCQRPDSIARATV